MNDRFISDVDIGSQYITEQRVEQTNFPPISICSYCKDLIFLIYLTQNLDEFQSDCLSNKFINFLSSKP